MGNKRIRRRERRAIIKALRAGVVPRAGLQHIQVGRSAEIDALIQDIEHVREGGSTVRFIIGEYGSGKTFFLNLIRQIALKKNLVVVNADLSPDRRLYSSGDHARSLYAELMRNMSTRTRQGGGALRSVVERFIGQLQKKAEDEPVEDLLQERLSELEELVSGYDFAGVLAQYWRGHREGDTALQTAAIRWLRAEYPHRTAAKKELDVSTIIDSDNYYDYLKLMARFVRLAGYEGLLVCMDEMVNLYKLHHKVSRTRNYEQILHILNDSLQGHSSGLGFLFGGTPEFLMDSYRGLFSYEALQTRLAENTFAQDGLVDLTGPVIRLQNLSPEDLYVLLQNIRNVFAGGDAEKYLVPDEALQAFMDHCSKHIGDAYFKTPRSTVQAFTDFLAILEQNPEAQWQDLLGRVTIEKERDPALAPLDDGQEEQAVSSNGHASTSSTSGSSDSSDDDLSSFRL